MEQGQNDTMRLIRDEARRPEEGGELRRQPLQCAVQQTAGAGRWHGQRRQCARTGRPHCATPQMGHMRRALPAAGARPSGAPAPSRRLRQDAQGLAGSARDDKLRSAGYAARVGLGGCWVFQTAGRVPGAGARTRPTGSERRPAVSRCIAVYCLAPAAQQQHAARRARHPAQPCDAMRCHAMPAGPAGMPAMLAAACLQAACMPPASAQGRACTVRRPSVVRPSPARRPDTAHLRLASPARLRPTTSTLLPAPCLSRRPSRLRLPTCRLASSSCRHAPCPSHSPRLCPPPHHSRSTHTRPLPGLAPVPPPVPRPPAFTHRPPSPPASRPSAPPMPSHRPCGPPPCLWASPRAPAP